jgi:hypothetical protein
MTDIATLALAGNQKVWGVTVRPHDRQRRPRHGGRFGVYGSSSLSPPKVRASDRMISPPTYFGHDKFGKYAPGLKNLSDAEVRFGS